MQGKQALRSLTACLDHHSPAKLQMGKAGWSRHQPASKVAVPADIHGGNAVAENYPSELSDALSVRTLRLVRLVWNRPKRSTTVKKSPLTIRWIMATCADLSQGLPCTDLSAAVLSIVIPLTKRRRSRWSGRRTSRNSLARHALILLMSRLVVGW